MNEKQKYRVRAVGVCIDGEINIPSEAKAISIHVVEGRRYPIYPMMVTWLEEAGE